MYDRVLTYPRLLKTSIALAQLALLFLSYKILSGQLDSTLAGTALAVGGFWLTLTAVRLRGLLVSYFDHLSRMQVVIPSICGVMLAALAAFSTSELLLQGIAAAELVAWLAVYIKYRRNRANFIKQGHGPLPKDAWVNPDWKALRPGDLILTGGAMAGRLHDTVGHAELVIRGEDGQLYTLSSFMKSGARVRRLEAVTSKLEASGIHYIGLRLRKPLSEEQLEQALQLARHYCRLNTEWREKANARRQYLISWLPAPRAFKNWLFEKTRATGYDWAGLFIGTRAKNRWTCIGICIQCLKQLGVEVRDYGTGMLGLGTGLLDPIQPVRLLGDPAFRLISQEDRQRSQATPV